MKLTADWILSKDIIPQPGGEITIDPYAGLITDTCFDEIKKNETSLAGTTFLTPGLINAHTHLEMYSDTSIPLMPNETISDWILQVVSRNRKMTELERLEACKKNVAELLRTGTTSVNDITSTGISLDVLSKAGMRGVVSPEFFYPFHEDFSIEHPVIKLFKTLKTEYKLSKLLNIGISPHSPYNVTPKALASLLKQIDPFLIHTHLAETMEEILWFQDGHSTLDKVHKKLIGNSFGPSKKGLSPLEYFMPLIDNRWAIAHGVFIKENELNLLAKSRASLIHCPRSNLWISGKSISFFSKLQQEGINIGLGTDSRYSSPDLDLRSEGRTAKSIHNMSSKAVFEMLTHGSATSIKLGEVVGRIAPGYAADLVLWWNPQEKTCDPYDLWLSPETEALQVIINGQIVFTSHQAIVEPYQSNMGSSL